jgi:hypothetical protein
MRAVFVGGLVASALGLTAPLVAVIHPAPAAVVVAVHPGPAPVAVHSATVPGAVAPVGLPVVPAAPVPIGLPPPPVASALNDTFLSALLAIGQAQQIDVQAAQAASFQYVQAVQQYRSGNAAEARRSALQALATARAAQIRPLTPAVPTPVIAAAPPQQPGTAGGLYGGDAPAIDADSFLALARGMIADCGTRDAHRSADAKAHLARAEADFAARNWAATRRDAKAAIDTCAKPRDGQSPTGS